MIQLTACSDFQYESLIAQISQLLTPINNKIDTIDGIVDEIVVDSRELVTDVNAVETVVDEIVVDSRELVTDVNAVLEDTDDLEADLKSDLDAERTTIVNEINANETKIDTIDGIVDEIVVDSRELVTDVNAVLEDTDDLEADLKSDLDAERTTIVNEINANETKIDTIDGIVDEIVVDSRELVTDVNAVLEDTDDLEADLKSDLDAERTTIVNEINANETKIDTIDGIVDEIVVDSRELVMTSMQSWKIPMIWKQI